MTYDERLLSESKLATLPLPPPSRLLSDNHKTGASLNLPLSNCRPTERCSEACYARVGPIAWPNRHYNPIDLDLLRNYNEALDEALQDAYQRALAGSCDYRVSKPTSSGQIGRTADEDKKSASA